MLGEPLVRTETDDLPEVDGRPSLVTNYLSTAGDWPSPRRATSHLPVWLCDAEEIRSALGARAARRFLELLYVAEEARRTNFASREDNHRAAATQYLTVARAATAAGTPG
jgi:hypothetical protein